LDEYYKRGLRARAAYVAAGTVHPSGPIPARRWLPVSIRELEKDVPLFNELEPL
jgi:hypothetical protein